MLLIKYFFIYNTKIPNFGNYEDFVRGIPSYDSLFKAAGPTLKCSKFLTAFILIKYSGDLCSIPKQFQFLSFSIIPHDLAHILIIV